MQKIASVVIESASPAFDKLYSYRIPARLEAIAKPGCRVRVPFGRGNKHRTGLILLAEDACPEGQLKSILTVLDEAPLLNEEGLWLVRCLKEQTFCLWFDAVKLLVPAGLSIASRVVYEATGAPPPEPDGRGRAIYDFITSRGRPVHQELLCEKMAISPRDPDLLALLECGAVTCGEELRQRVGDDTYTMIRASDPPPEGGRATPRQREVLNFLFENGPATAKEVHLYTGAGRGVVERLVQSGLAESLDVSRLRTPYLSGEVSAEPPALSEEQQAAFELLLAHAGQKEPSPALLHGVTGSGKTQVFLALAERVVQQGRGVIVMVPEISLTSQTVRTLQSRFGNRVAVLHSGLSLGERMDEWRRIRDGGADVVVGTRSAVFAPLPHLGLIVVDEEQEHTYKSDKSPRFHARDIARLRCRRHGAMLLLCSATPSVESYHMAKQGHWLLVELRERYGEAALPDVYVVAMNDPENLTVSQSLSEPLLHELRYNLEHGEQSILLLNRRGYSTLVRCSGCGAAAECPNCSVSLTYHAVGDRLSCHYCGHTQPRVSVCPTCGGEWLRYTGVGTQKLEEELCGLYPDARVLRMDMDTTHRRFAHERMFGAFAAGEYDILIGTQMVAKGLNFPRVTLVGVLMADQHLYSGDFRSYERSFSLLTQVAGRSGRGERPGRALIQTWSPDHPIIGLAAAQDYPAFFRQEIASRELHIYPPFCTIAGMGFIGEEQIEVKRAAEWFATAFAEIARADYPGIPLLVLGPSPGEVLKVAGRFRYKLLVKCKNSAPVRELIARVLERFHAEIKTASAFADLYYDRI